MNANIMNNANTTSELRPPKNREDKYRTDIEIEEANKCYTGKLAGDMSDKSANIDNIDSSLCGRKRQKGRVTDKSIVIENKNTKVTCENSYRVVPELRDSFADEKLFWKKVLLANYLDPSNKKYMEV